MLHSTYVELPKEFILTTYISDIPGCIRKYIKNPTKTNPWPFSPNIILCYNSEACGANIKYNQVSGIIYVWRYLPRSKTSDAKEFDYNDSMIRIQRNVSHTSSNTGEWFVRKKNHGTMLQMIKFQKSKGIKCKYLKICLFFLYLYFFINKLDTVITLILLYFTIMKSWVMFYELNIKKTKDLVLKTYLQKL